MSFGFKGDRPLGKESHRLARKQVDLTLQVLSAGRQNSDGAVHEARKAFKRIRAILRMVRPEIGAALYRRENACFRDAGRPLTEVRDAKVLVETVDKLAEHFADQVAKDSFAEARKELVAHHRAVRNRVLTKEKAIQNVRSMVRQARGRLKDWTRVADQWRSIGKGVQRVYKQARRGLATAKVDPTVENLHECRRQAKYHRYHLEILSPLYPEVLEPLAEQVDHMCEMLGDDHDLALLRQKVTAETDTRGEPGLEVLVALIDRRRAELQQEALLLGERVFLDRPREVERRFKGYWRTWHKQLQTDTYELAAAQSG